MKVAGDGGIFSCQNQVLEAGEDAGKARRELSEREKGFLFNLAPEWWRN